MKQLRGKHQVQVKEKSGKDIAEIFSVKLSECSMKNHTRGIVN